MYGIMGIVTDTDEKLGIVQVVVIGFDVFKSHRIHMMNNDSVCYLPTLDSEVASVIPNNHLVPGASPS